MLRSQVEEAEQGGADWIHLDIMDGHFVPNISFGAGVVQAVRSVTSLPLDVHLMIEAPERYLRDFAAAGAQTITVHHEACRHLHRTVEEIHALGVQAGVAINPATPAMVLSDILPDLDLVLVMSVNPGFGGQRYIAASAGKVARVARMAREAGRPQLSIEVDGGVDATNLPELVEAGANVLVAGSAVFRRGESAARNVQTLREAIAPRG